MGITTPLDGIPAEGIGGLRLGVTPLELTDAYATLAAGGIHRDPVAIEKVTFPDGKVDEPQAAKPKRVLPEAVAYEVTRLLHDNITEGTGTAAYTGCAGQAGKTGTTDEYTDAWFSGYQPNLATAVWVGYPESNDISMSSVHGRTVFGGTFPAEIWHSLYADGGVPCEEFERARGADQLGPLLRPLHPGQPERQRRRGELGGSSESRRRPAAPRSAATTRTLTTPTPTRPAPARNRRRCHRPRHPRPEGAGMTRRAGECGSGPRSG